MFRLTKEEYADLKCQFGISSDGHGGRRHSPYAFTEQGVAMLSSVLRSKRAVAVNIEIMRALVEIRQAAADYKELEKRISDLEKTAAGKFGEHETHLAAGSRHRHGLMRRVAALCQVADGITGDQ